jgi:hypothetical protein
LILAFKSGQKVLYNQKFYKGYKSDAFIAYFIINETEF